MTNTCVYMTNTHENVRLHTAKNLVISPRVCIHTHGTHNTTHLLPRAFLDFLSFHQFFDPRPCKCVESENFE